jgi:hypothetical protein
MPRPLAPGFFIKNPSFDLDIPGGSFGLPNRRIQSRWDVSEMAAEILLKRLNILTKSNYYGILMVS